MSDWTYTRKLWNTSDRQLYLRWLYLSQLTVQESSELVLCKHRKREVDSDWILSTSCTIRVAIIDYCSRVGWNRTRKLWHRSENIPQPRLAEITPGSYDTGMKMFLNHGWLKITPGSYDTGVKMFLIHSWLKSHQQLMRLEWLLQSSCSEEWLDIKSSWDKSCFKCHVSVVDSNHAKLFWDSQ